MHASETNDANPDGVLREQTKEEQWQALLEQLRVKAIANPGPVAPPLIMGVCACYTCLARIVRNFGLSQCDCASLAWRWLCVCAGEVGEVDVDLVLRKQPDQASKRA